MRAFAPATGFALLVFLVACESDDLERRVDPVNAPRGSAFRPVAQVLVHRCGSLDCHESKYRNMRLFGFGSARIDPGHRPDAPDTTDDEADRDYEAVVALEPELTRRVVSEGGHNPERLTFVRKSRAAESHVGGQKIVPGDAADRCIRSWLASNVDGDACKTAVPRLAEP